LKPSAGNARFRFLNTTVEAAMPLIDLSRRVTLAPSASEAVGEQVAGAAGGDGNNGGEKAASEPAVTADVEAVLIGYAIVVIGALVAIWLWSWRDPKDFTPGEGISVFAPLYILAQAIERLIEPFATYLGKASPEETPPGTPTTGGGVTGRKSKPDAQWLLNQAVAAGNAPAAAIWSRVVDKIRRNTAVITWTLASALAMVFCGLFGLYLLRLVGFTDVPRQVDIIISGLAVGSGTKPLHDLISNVQKAKEQKEDPPEKKAA
jgi:hypothetical protein